MEIMALRVGPIPHKCNVSNHGIDHVLEKFHHGLFYQASMSTN